MDVPPGVVIGTDVFDQFLVENDLHSFALNSTDDKEITRRFVTAERFPREVVDALTDFLKFYAFSARCPFFQFARRLSVSSVFRSLRDVHDSQQFAGLEVRLKHLITTIKGVYASTFCQAAKDYIKVTTYRLEEEKMAVVIQKMVGAQHENRFYPDFSGVAILHNYYPMTPQKAADGIVSAALGLGKMIVDGGKHGPVLSKYPKQTHPYSSAEERLQNSQDGFYSLDMQEIRPENSESCNSLLLKQNLDEAEKDGTLRYVVSTYSPENDAISDGLSRAGVRLVTFAPILKDKIFPLPQIVEQLLGHQQIRHGRARRNGVCCQYVGSTRIAAGIRNPSGASDGSVS